MISACDTNIWINLVLCKTKYHSRVNTFYSNLDNHMNFKDLMRIKYFEKISPNGYQAAYYCFQE